MGLGPGRAVAEPELPRSAPAHLSARGVYQFQPKTSGWGGNERWVPALCYPDTYSADFVIEFYFVHVNSCTSLQIKLALFIPLILYHLRIL